MTDDDPIRSKYGYRAGKGDWLGVVYRQQPGGRTLVLTLGVETSKAAIRDWCRLAMKNRPWETGRPPAPDAVDRARNTRH